VHGRELHHSDQSKPRQIQLDLEALVPKLLAASKDEKAMELGLEMLVRAYDPCISCSTHYLKVEFKR